MEAQQRVDSTFTLISGSNMKKEKNKAAIRATKMLWILQTWFGK
jgi:hypothetical protein